MQNAGDTTQDAEVTTLDAGDPTQGVRTALGGVLNWVDFVIELMIASVTRGEAAPPPRNPENRNLLQLPQSNKSALLTSAVQCATSAAQNATHVASRIHGCCEDLAALYRSQPPSRPDDSGDEGGWEFVDDYPPCNAKTETVDDYLPCNREWSCDAGNGTEVIYDEKAGFVVVSHYFPSDATAAFNAMVGGDK